MPAAVPLLAFPQFFDQSGKPLSGGRLYTFESGTTTPKATFTSQPGTTANPNPIVLDSAGRAHVWLAINEPYTLLLKTAADVTLWSEDNVYGGADPAQLVVAGTVPAAGGTYTGPVVFEQGATFQGDDAATLNSLGIQGVQTANLWTNSDFQIIQRGLGTVADAAYGPDQAIVLCDAGSVSTAVFAPGVDGLPNAMRITQPDVTAKRMGVLQIVEAKNCMGYRGKNMVFAAKVRSSVAQTVRIALVAWTGTVDAPTRDVVNNWSSTTYTAANFFVANTAPITSAAVAINAATWTDVVVSSASGGGVVAPSTMNNLYMLIWTDQPVAQTVTLEMTAMRCTQGTTAPAWAPPNAAIEMGKCERYYEIGVTRDDGYGQGGQAMVSLYRYRTAKRVSPTVFYQNTLSSNLAANTMTSNGIDGIVQVLTIGGAVFVTYNGANNWQASAEL